MTKALVAVRCDMFYKKFYSEMNTQYSKDVSCTKLFVFFYSKTFYNLAFLYCCVNVQALIYQCLIIDSKCLNLYSLYTCMSGYYQDTRTHGHIYLQLGTHVLVHIAFYELFITTTVALISSALTHVVNVWLILV